MVWRKSATATAADPWQPFAAGLPTNLPVTGIGVAPDRGLYVSSKGRGIWWRRDIG